MPFGVIKSIEINDKNTTNDFGKRKNSLPNVAFYGESSKHTCLTSRSRNNEQTQSWKIYLSKVKRHISYLELVFASNGKKKGSDKLNNIMLSAKTSSLRECEFDYEDVTQWTVKIHCLINQFEVR
jgi:hypothetical protein